MNKKPKISNAKLDALTLKVSTLLCEEGFDFKFNEDQNFIRSLLADLFFKWAGYEIEPDATSRYVSWIDIRKKLHIPNPFK